MEEKTLKKWIESIREDKNKNNLYGIMEENNDPNFIPDYIPWYTKKEFLEKESDNLNKIVVQFIPSFLIMGKLDKPQEQHHLFIIKKEEIVIIIKLTIFFNIIIYSYSK